jgi:hypothetical protein
MIFLLFNAKQHVTIGFYVLNYDYVFDFEFLPNIQAKNIEIQRECEKDHKTLKSDIWAMFDAVLRNQIVSGTRLAVRQDSTDC